MENRKIRWGIIGTAEIATKVVAGMHDAANADVVAVASRSLDRAKAWADEHEVPQAFGSYDELLADERIDAVYLPLPTAIRNEWIKKAARAGKHVYAEKPLADGIEEAIEVCKENGVQFMDGTMWLHSTRTHDIEKRIAEGDIGEIRRVTSAFTFKAPSREWYVGGNGRTAGAGSGPGRGLRQPGAGLGGSRLLAEAVGRVSACGLGLRGRCSGRCQP